MSVRVVLKSEGFDSLRRELLADVGSAARSLTAQANSVAQIQGAQYEYCPPIPTERGCVALVSTRPSAGGRSRGNWLAWKDNKEYGTLNKLVSQ